MDLKTTYLGLKLPHPLVVGASPLVDDLGTVRRLEDAGAAAIVMHSLFEEQIEREHHSVHDMLESHGESFAEAQSFHPQLPHFPFGPERYLNHLRKVKEAVSIPVIGSLNGTTAAGWLEYASLIEEAGAAALELNFYYVATDPAEDGRAVEKRLFEIVRDVKKRVKIPVAIKLSPYYSSCAHVAVELDRLGADGLVLFNRFYQPDLDVEALEVLPSLKLSHSSELLLRLRWLAILSGRIKASLAASGGVHSGLDAIKAVMAGADAVQMVSALLERGPEYLREVRTAMAGWMEEHEYESVAQMKGCMNLTKCPDPRAFERTNYMRVLQIWRQA